MINGFDIICISTSDWERPLGNRQQLMSLLSATNRVLFIEYQMSILHFLKYPNLLLKMFSPRIRKINDNLIIYRPWVNLPFRYYSKIINLLNQKFLLLQLKILIKQLKFSKILLWIFEPTAYFLVGRLKENISIYHCLDFFKNEKGSYSRKKCIEELERMLCEKCDVVFVSANELLIDKVNLNKETYLISPAVNESFLDINKALPEQATIEKIPGARIGFVGTLDHRIDYELIDFIARDHHDWAVILVGLIERKEAIRRLRARKNIHILGWKDNNLLPAYINMFDVCIIPYKINEFTKGISPIKIFEYLALGKPVVTTSLPSLKTLNMDNFIRIAKNKDEFKRYITDYLVNDDLKTKNDRIEFTRTNTWQCRVEIISKIINNLCRV